MAKSICFLIPALTIGGAEKLTLSIINKLCEYKKFNIYLILLENNMNLKVPDDVKIFILSPLSTHSKIKVLFTPIYIYKINKIINKYNIEILYSVMERSNFINALISFFNHKFIPILSVHNAPSLSFKNRSYIKQIFIKFLYKYLVENKKIVVVSDGIKNELNSIFNIDKHNVIVISNPIDINLIQQLSLEETEDIIDHNKFNIVAVGRLVKAKGFDNLIKAFYKIDEKDRQNMNLIIIGDGEEKQHLYNLIVELNLVDYVKLLGYQKNPYKYMKQCNIFVLSSRWEGFGIVLTEAMSLKLPIVATDCKYGPSDILSKQEQYFGILVKNDKFVADNIKNAILDFYDDRNLLNQYKNLSIKRVEDFSISIIIKQYADLFDKVLNAK